MESCGLYRTLGAISQRDTPQACNSCPERHNSVLRGCCRTESCGSQQHQGPPNRLNIGRQWPCRRAHGKGADSPPAWANAVQI